MCFLCSLYNYVQLSELKLYYCIGMIIGNIVTGILPSHHFRLVKQKNLFEICLIEIGEIEVGVQTLHYSTSALKTGSRFETLI